MRKRYFCKMFVMLISTTLLSAGCFSHAIPVLAEETASESDSPVDTNLDCDIQTDEVSNQENDSVTDSNQCEEPESSDAMEESVTTEDSEQDSLDGSIKDDIVQEEEAPEAKEIENYGDISSATSFSGTGYEVWDGKTMTQPSRSLLDIYQVGTPAELKWIQNEVNVKGNNVLRFALTDDINLGNYPWTPIGTEEKPFDGRVFGDNHTIYNMNITPESSKGSASCGLFGTIAVTSTISYLTVNGSINSNANYIGGIVGRVEGVEGAYTWLSYCTSNVSITIGEGASWCYCGGIAGTIEYGRVRNCINNGEITNIGKQDYTVGGIVGSVIGTSIIDCKNTGEIKGGIAGGIAGNSRDESSFVEMCYNTGTINASYIACGLVGDLRNSHLAHGYNDAPVVLFGSSGRLAAPCAFDYYSFYDTEDLWYTNYIEGESTCGTYTEFGDLMFNVRIEGFKTVCGGAPALLWEETEEHNLGSYEKYLGYEKRDCNKCTYTEINWEDERLQVIYYDENAVSAIAFIDSYKFDPWYLNSRYNSSSFNPILPDKSLISEEIKDYDVASSLCLNFSLKKPAIIKADYSLFHALYNEQLTITIARRIDDRHEWLCNDIFQGSYEGSETMLLEPGDYYFRALVNKTEDNTGDDYGAYGVITHLSIISSEIPLTITSQPQSIASAKIGDTVSYRVSAENVSSYQWQYSKDGKEWFNSSAASAKTSTLSLKLSDSNKTNKYRCKLTDQAGKAHYTDSVWVKQVIVDAFKITAQPQSVASAKIGDTITYRVTAQNAASYQWQYSKDAKTWYNSSASSAKTAALSIVLSTSNSGNKYRCKITDKQGGVHYTNIVSVQQVISFSITKQPSDWDVTKGKAASFSVTATGASSYQWQYSKDRGKTWVKSSITPTLSGGTSTIKVNIAPSNAANVYRCKVTGKDGSVLITRTAIFKGAPILTGQPKNVTYQAGKTAVFTVTVSNASICTFQWQYSKDGGKNWYNSGASGSKTKSMSITMKESNLGMLYRCKITGSNNVYLYTNRVNLVK